MDAKSLSDFVEMAIRGQSTRVDVYTRVDVNMCVARNKLYNTVALYESPAVFDTKHPPKPADDPQRLDVRIPQNLKQFLEEQIGIRERPEARLIEPRWGAALAATI